MIAISSVHRQIILKPMQSIFSIFLLSLALIIAPDRAFAQETEKRDDSANTPLKVLFIGNSYTYYNNMPTTLAAMSAAPGQTRRIEVTEVTKGGATLEKMGSLRTTQHTLSEGHWDYVVLQEQSLLPIREPERMHRAVKQLDADIRKAGAKTVLYLTWARQSQPDTQPAFDRAYSTLAQEIKATLAPVGRAWQAASKLAPNLPLYAADGSHPSPTGSYLAACVLYLALLSEQTQCPRLTLNGVTAENADIVRQASASTAAAMAAERR